MKICIEYSEEGGIVANCERIKALEAIDVMSRVLGGLIWSGLLEDERSWGNAVETIQQLVIPSIRYGFVDEEEKNR